MITEKDARPPLSGAGPEEVVNRYQYNDSSFLNTLLKAWPDVKAEAPPPRCRALVVVAVKNQCEDLSVTCWLYSYE